VTASRSRGGDVTGRRASCQDSCMPRILVLVGACGIVWGCATESGDLGALDGGICSSGIADVADGRDYCAEVTRAGEPCVICTQGVGTRGYYAGPCQCPPPNPVCLAGDGGAEPSVRCPGGWEVACPCEGQVPVCSASGIGLLGSCAPEVAGCDGTWASCVRP
jgi:hypothetical protein